MDTTPNISLCDEEYIDMKLCPSPSQSREFEFQMSSCTDKATITSPADELFYKGKLLPLHLPPRRLMLQNLLSTTDPYPNSCSISPSESCRASCDLDPHDHFFEWSSELNTFINNHPTKPKLKKSILGMTLEASRTFLKSFFTSSSKNKQFRHIEGGRRSFSGAIKRHSPAKCLSSSSSNSSSSSSSLSLHSNEPHSLRRSSRATEIEGSIQAAIAHCKKSHQDEESRKRPVC